MNKGVSGNKLEMMSTRSAGIVAVSNTVIADNRLLTLLLQIVSHILTLLVQSIRAFIQIVDKSQERRGSKNDFDQFLVARSSSQIRSYLATGRSQKSTQPA